MARRRQVWLIVGGIAAVLVLLVVVVGMLRTQPTNEVGALSGAEPSTSDVRSGPPAQGAAEALTPGPDAKPAERADAVPVVPPGGRAMARSARMAVEVTDVTPGAQEVRDAVLGAGGQVAEEKIRDGVAVLTLRVPADRLDGVLSGVAQLGKVTERSAEARDVTEQVVDLESRLATQRASVGRVRALLDRATTIGEIVQIESELTSREAELESLQARLASLGTQVAMSTLRVELRPAGAGPAAEDGGFLAGLSGGWDAFLTAGRAVLVAVGAALPFLTLAGVLALALLAIRRRLRARRRDTEPAAATDAG